jgi:hypothetical protein
MDASLGMYNKSTFDAFKILKNITSIKTTEVGCNIINKRATVTPLTTGDDLRLRTMFANPDIIEAEIIGLIYKHTNFVDIKDKLSYDDFITFVSDWDKRNLLWGLYNATYSTLGKQQIVCPKCRKNWTDEIKCTELIEPSNIAKLFDKVGANNVPTQFWQYYFPISVDLNSNTKLEFVTSIPSIANKLDVLSYISAEAAKENIRTNSSILTRIDMLIMITREIYLITTENDSQSKLTTEATIESDIDQTTEQNVEQPTKSKENRIVIVNPQEIRTVIIDYLSLDNATVILEKFFEHFTPYFPTFKKQYNCKFCGNEFPVTVEIDVKL